MNPAPVKEEVPYELFEQLDIRVGTILTVSDVEGSKKLVRLGIDVGDHRRNILAGIKQERADPKVVEGQQALFVLNLPNRKMAGEISEGMLFDLGYADGLTRLENYGCCRYIKSIVKKASPHDDNGKLVPFPQHELLCDNDAKKKPFQTKTIKQIRQLRLSVR